MKKLFLTIITIVCFLAMVAFAWAGLSVELEWTANSEPDLAGYNIYRADNDGGPYTKIGSTTTTGYIDGNLVFDVNYYWVVTAYDYDSNESGHSNQVSNMTGTPPPPDTTPPGTPQDINVNVHITIDR